MWTSKLECKCFLFSHYHLFFVKTSESSVFYQRNEVWWSWSRNPMLQYLRNFFVLVFSRFVLFCFVKFNSLYSHAYVRMIYEKIPGVFSRLRTLHDLHWEDKTYKLRLPDAFDRWRVLFKLWFLFHSKGLSAIFSVIFKREKDKMEKSKCWRRNDGYETLVTPKEKWSTRICFTIIVLKSSKIGATQPLNL